jgi:hypothetical protein
MVIDLIPLLIKANTTYHINLCPIGPQAQGNVQGRTPNLGMLGKVIKQYFPKTDRFYFIFHLITIKKARAYGPCLKQL